MKRVGQRFLSIGQVRKCGLWQIWYGASTEKNPVLYSTLNNFNLSSHALVNVKYPFENPFELSVIYKTSMTTL